MASGGRQRSRLAEQALFGCLTDNHQLIRLSDAGLCHGWAGLVHTARRAATDAGSTELAATIVATTTGRMRHHLHKHGPPADQGFLEGAAGWALVDAASDIAETAAQQQWDTCLLVG
jgi:hypothetical protein